MQSSHKQEVVGLKLMRRVSRRNGKGVYSSLIIPLGFVDSLLVGLSRADGSEVEASLQRGLEGDGGA